MKAGLSLLILSLQAQALYSPPVRAEEPLVVVASQTSSLNQLTREDVASLFLGVIRTVKGGEKVVVLDLDDEELKDAFYRNVAHRTHTQVRAYWAKMVFTGNGRPPANLPMDKLVEKLRADSTAIGYLPASKAAGFKVLLVVPD